MIALSVWIHYIRHLQIIGETILTQHMWLSLMACLKNMYSRWMTWWIYCEPCLCVIAGLKSRLLHFILGHFMNNSQRPLNGFRPDTPTCNLAELGYECTEFRHWSTSVRVFYHIFHILQWQVNRARARLGVTWERRTRAESNFSWLNRVQADGARAFLSVTLKDPRGNSRRTKYRHCLTPRCARQIFYLPHVQCLWGSARP
jgi:hypothetical protein